MTDINVINAHNASDKQTMPHGDETNINQQYITIEPSEHNTSVKQDQDSVTYANTAVMTDRNITNAQTDSDKQDETNIYEGYLTIDSNHCEQSMNKSQNTKKTSLEGSNQASGRRKYMIIGIIVGVVACICAGASLCFAVTAWKNAVHAQVRQIEDRIIQIEERQSDIVNATESRLMNIENDTVKFQSMINEIKIRQIEDRIIKIEERQSDIVNATESRLMNIENDTVKFQGMINEIKNSQHAARSAAFMAAISSENNFLKAGDVIVFKTVMVNIGQHYDSTSSVFTCPQHGLYLISFSLYSGALQGNSYERLGGTMMLDSVEITEVYSRNRDTNTSQHHQAATTVVLDCPTGGRVWIECQWNSVKIFGSLSMPSSVFTGFAIIFF